MMMMMEIIKGESQKSSSSEDPLGSTDPQYLEKVSIVPYCSIVQWGDFHKNKQNNS